MRDGDENLSVFTPHDRDVNFLTLEDVDEVNVIAAISSNNI